jgi:hypothetical protein
MKQLLVEQALVIPPLPIIIIFLAKPPSRAAKGNECLSPC